MTRVVVLGVLALAAAAAVAYTPVKWTNFYVKFSVLSYLSHITGNAYFKVPLTSTEAQKDGWEQAATRNLTTIWCWKDDPRVCVLYDQKGTVAGMQVSLPVADVQFKGNPYDVTTHPLFMRDTLLNKDVFSARYYLVDQQTLEAGGRERPDEVGTGLWLQRGDEYIEIPRNSDDLEKSWTRENCILQMGRHYYYNISEEMQCKDFEPFFLLVDNKNDALHGIGFQTIGKASVKKRQWFESIPSFAVKPTIPNAPQCLVDWASEYGVVSLHMYFVDSPWFITC